MTLHRHSGVSRNPENFRKKKTWTPAFAGVTLAVIFLGIVSIAHAVQPDEMLQDPALEARAREISKDMRCLVCQNQSIDDSDAPLARDLRILLRQRLMAGDTNEEVQRYIVSRYGDYVLLTPPLKASTLLLWLGPAVLLLLALGGMVSFYRRGRKRT